MSLGRTIAFLIASIAAWAPTLADAQSKYGVLAQPQAVAPSPWVGSAPATPSYGGVQQSPYGTPTWGSPEPSAYGYATPDYGGSPYSAAPPQPGYEQPAFNPYGTGQAAPAPLLRGGVDWGASTTERVVARAGGGSVLGDDIGMEGSHSWFQGFFPVFQNPGQTVTFADTRAIKFYEDSEAYGLNLAAGHRWYAPGMNRVHGGYASYDYRNTGRFDFNQVSFGVESLGRLWDVRANGYVVMGNDRFLLSQSDSFSGMNLVRTLNYFDAFSGFDGEIGRNLTPASPDLDLRIFVGGYRFTSDGPDDATGLRVRGEARFWDQVDVGIAFQHDSVFDTTFNVSVAFLVGGIGRPTTASEANQAHRLDDPLHKNMHIVLGNVSERVLHLDVDDNTPLTMLHANSNSPAGGDGTFEAPLQTLAATEAAAAADNPDIVLLHAGSTFTGESITISNEGQQLLGDNGLAALLDPDRANTTVTQFGTVELPRANSSLSRPIIDTAPAPGAVVIAADNVEVANLDINEATQHGITANGVTGARIRSNLIVRSGGDGVSASNLTNAQIRFNNIFDSGGSGVMLSGTTGGTETAIQNNRLVDSTLNGLSIANLQAGTIASNEFEDNDGSGLLITNLSDGRISLNVTQGNLGNGIEVTTMLGGELFANQALANRTHGFLIGNATSGNLFTNNATGNDGNGYLFTNLNGDATLATNNARANGDAGFRFGTVNGGVIDRNSSNANTGDGFAFALINDGTIVMNSAIDNLGRGYNVLLMPGGTAPGNTGSGNAGGGDTYDAP